MRKNLTLLILALFIIISANSQRQYKAMMDDMSVNFYEVCTAADTYFATHSKGKGSGWKGFQRWKVANESKFYPSGKRDNVDHFIAEHSYEAFIKGLTLTNYSSGWKELGPSRIDSVTGQYSVGLGRVEAVYVDPTDSLKMYLGSRSGGFWLSADGGQTWLCTTDTLIATGVNTIAVSPTNSDSILINVRNARNGYSHGIYRSTDGGLSWTQSNFNPTILGYGGLGSNFSILSIKYHPTVPNLIFIGTNRGIYKSTDNLQTWTQTMNNADVGQIAFHPSNSNIMYICDSYYYSSNLNKVYRSSNQGNTYTAVTIANNNNKAGKLSVSPLSPNSVYFASTSGVWRSVNSGLSYTFLSNPSGSCHGFAVSDTDTLNMIYGYLDVNASTDGGNNFSQVTFWSLGNTNGAGSGHQNSFNTSTDYVHADLHPAICVNGVFYIGTDGAFSKGTNGGTHWQMLNQGTGIRENYKLGISQSNHYRSISGSQDNGTSIKHQNDWIEYYGADGMEGIIHPLNDDYMIGSVQYGTRKKTTDGGNNELGCTPTNGGDGYWEAPIAYDPNNQMRIFDFRDSIYVSEDFGDSWSVRGKPISFSAKIKRAAIAENNSNIIVVASDKYIDKSTDGGYTFSNIRHNLPSSSIEDIAFDPNDDNTFIVVYGSYQNNNSKVYITHNGGQSWTNITHNLGNMPIRSVVIDHTSASNIYLGAEIGVYTKPMSSTNWVLYNPDLPNVAVEELEINYGSNAIKIATWGRGMWEYSLVGRNTYPSVLKTRITDMPTPNSPIAGIDQFITSVVSYNGNLTNVFVKWAKDSIVLSNTIAMTNIQDSTWKSVSAIPNFAAGSKVYFKVFAVGSNGDTTQTYRFMYKVSEYKYCDASGSLDGYNLHITNVNAANINNPTTNNLYTYYADSVLMLYRDSSYSITVESSTSWSGNDFGAWIDYNHNAMFDDGENLNLIETAGDVATAVFTVPSNAYLLDTLRLRVRLSYWGDDAEPCGTTMGEVEDYPVLVSLFDTIAPVADSANLSDYYAQCAATPPAPTASDNALGTVYGTSNVAFPITNIGTTVVTWTYSDSNGNTSQQQQNVIITPLDTSVTVSGLVLSANASGYNYQWLDCNDSYSIIQGAINQSYTTTVNGSFAVEISNTNCSDTSSCITIVDAGIGGINKNIDVDIYPNPTKDKVNIINNTNQKLNLNLYDIAGKLILSIESIDNNIVIDLQNYSDGVYILRISNDKSYYFERIIKE